MQLSQSGTTRHCEPQQHSQEQSQKGDDCFVPDEGLQEFEESATKKECKTDTTTCQLDNKQSALRAYGRLVGMQNLHFPKKWQDLAPITKRKRKQKTKELVKKVIETVSPDGAEELKQDMLKNSEDPVWSQGVHTPAVAAILSAITGAYRSADTRQQRLQLLSIVVNDFPLAVLQQYLPGLTQYMFKRARHYAAQFGPGTHTELQTKGVKLRIPENHLRIALDFIASDLVSIPSPFGTTKMKLSDGEKREIDLYIRKQSKQHIFNLYSNYMAETGQQHEMLSRSLFLSILEKCPAKTRHSVHGLDNYSFAGLEAIDSLLNEISNWEKDGLVTTEWFHEKKGALIDGKMYLRADYKAHLVENSKIADHCMQWALSDHNKKAFRHQSEGRVHDHDQKCPRCAALQDVLSDLQDFVDDSNTHFQSDTKKDAASFLVQKAIGNVFAWKQHQLRTVHQDTSRTAVWANLKENEVFIILDFAMKWLPAHGRESQQMWFGKHGISWHIATVFRKKGNGILVRYYVHVLDQQTPQDSWTVAALLKDVLQRVHQEVPSVDAAYVRSDNAGCYHSNKMASTVHHISAVTGVTIRCWDYSEPQSGKGPCDRVAAWVKRKVQAFIAEGNAALTPEQFIDAAKSYGGTKGASLILGTIEQAPERVPQATISDISKYFNFAYTEDGITVWKAYGIGTGIKIPLSKIQGKHLNSHFTKTKAYHESTLEINSGPESTDMFWKVQSEETTETPIPTAVSDGSVEVSDALESESLAADGFSSLLFSCPTEGCTRQFRYEANLARHFILDKHTYANERETAIDFAQRNYEAALGQSNLLTIRRAQESMITSLPTVGPTIEMGWALKTTHPSTPFDDAQKDYLAAKFEEGATRRNCFFYPFLSAQSR